MVSSRDLAKYWYTYLHVFTSYNWCFNIHIIFPKAWRGNVKIIRSVERTNTTYITIVSTTGRPTSVTVWKELCKLSGSRSSLFLQGSTQTMATMRCDSVEGERESEHGAHRQATITFCGVWSVAHFFPPFTYILGRTQINRIITTTTKNKLNECWVFEENSFVIRSCARSSFHCFFLAKEKICWHLFLLLSFFKR